MARSTRKHDDASAIEHDEAARGAAVAEYDLSAEYGTADTTPMPDIEDTTGAEASDVGTHRNLALRNADFQSYLASLGYDVGKRVTLPLLKLDTRPRIVRFDTPFYLGQEVEDGKNMETPIMARVVDMTTGEECEMICGAVLISEMARSYGGADAIAALRQMKKPSDADRAAAVEQVSGHVGKVFAISKLKPEGQRRYSIFNIVELTPRAA